MWCLGTPQVIDAACSITLSADAATLRPSHLYVYQHGHVTTVAYMGRALASDRAGLLACLRRMVVILCMQASSIRQLIGVIGGTCQPAICAFKASLQACAAKGAICLMHSCYAYAGDIMLCWGYAGDISGNL